MKCPSCGAESNGRFCSDCGAPLADAACTRCSAALLPGARFCTQCGAPARSAIGGNTGWYVAAGMLMVMIAVVGILATRDPSAAAGSADATGAVAPFAGSTNGGGTGAVPPPLTGTPREQADRLFDRIMRERAAGNIAGAEQFLPMGIAAYQQAGELEPDGLYHLALLQASANQHADAITTAERILATQPDHLLALGAAGESAEEAGDSSAARAYYERFLKAYPTEKTKTTAEYLDHSKVLVPYEEAARRLVK